jgi:hypothetical protein
LAKLVFLMIADFLKFRPTADVPINIIKPILDRFAGYLFNF